MVQITSISAGETVALSLFLFLPFPISGDYYKTGTQYRLNCCAWFLKAKPIIKAVPLGKPVIAHKRAGRNKLKYNYRKGERVKHRLDFT